MALVQEIPAYEPGKLMVSTTVHSCEGGAFCGAVAFALQLDSGRTGPRRHRYRGPRDGSCSTTSSRAGVRALR